jgi:tRNA(His) guanylyltransferase
MTATDKTSLGDRMKAYEDTYDASIINRIPVVIRCDGKGFSKWTKRQQMVKPFDDRMCKAMANTMLEVASHIEGCVFGYTQSDEMTFVLRNDQSTESEPWFGNRVQKMASIVSSMVTAHFNAKMMGPIAYFDARVFAVPTVMEAINCLVWRQNDATKNSISCAAYYEVGKVKGKKTARNLMHGLNQKQQQELLFKEANINWNDYPSMYKRGLGCYREKVIHTDANGMQFERNPWKIDEELPVFSKNQEFLIKLMTKEE